MENNTKKFTEAKEVLEYIKNKGGVWRLTQDEKEKLGALSDCLQAATPGHAQIPPMGHDVGYFFNAIQYLII